MKMQFYQGNKMFFFMVKKHLFQTLPFATINVFLGKSKLHPAVIIPVPLIFNFYINEKKEAKKPLVARHLENTHNAKISTIKTTKCGKIMKLK